MKLIITKAEYKLIIASLIYQKKLLEGYSERDREKYSLIIKKIERNNGGNNIRKSTKQK